MKERRYLRESHEDKKRGEDNRKADGSHLGMGSSEYRELILDRKGISEKEQDVINQGKIDLDKALKEEQEDLYQASLAQAPASERHAKDFLDRKRQKGFAIKSGAKTKTQARLQYEASLTDTLKDDRWVEYKLPKVLDDAMYDLSKTDRDLSYEL